MMELPYKPDDNDIVNALAGEWSGKFAYFWGKWREYRNGFWRVMYDEELEYAVRKSLTASNYRSVELKITSGRIKSIVAVLKADPIFFVRDEDIDRSSEKEGNYLNLQNGLLNLNTWQLEAHTPSLYFPAQLDFSYNEADSAPVFMKFLRSSLVQADGKPDESMIMLLLQGMGYTLTTRTDLRTSFWLVGKTASGKSTIIDLMHALLGEYAATCDLNQLATNRFMFADFAGKRLISTTEAAQGLLPDHIYKTLVGGTDRIYADVKNSRAISYRPAFTVWFGMNEPPRFSDRSGAFLNRLTPIVFNRTIPENERDPELMDKLRAERSGILWKIKGAYNRLRSAGKFEFCQQSADWLARYAVDNDTEREFVSEMLKYSDTGFIKSSELYSLYAGWCKENGFGAKNRNQVRREWERLGFKRAVKDGYELWRGIEQKERRGKFVGLQ